MLKLLVALAALSTFSRPARAAPAPAPAPGEEGRGTLERESLDEALAARGLKLDPAPEGKTIGEVHVVTLEVFSSRDSFFQWFNIFHRTSREDVVRREALFHPGEPYRQEIVDETTRNLRDPFLSNVVVIVPVQPPPGAPPGRVDVLIVTRDVWSLRLNTDFEVQQGDIVSLTASISENNLFGWRKKAALVFDMDQGAYAIGPTYLDPNIGGTRLTLRASARAIFRRDGGSSEGSSSGVTLAYPLYSLASKWGASVAAGHSDGVVRRFVGNQLARVDFAATPEIKERWPWIYRVRRASVTEGVVRSFGRRVIQRVSGGHELASVRPSFTGDFPEDPQAREQFARERFPRSERVSAVYLSYGLFTPRYKTYRDLNTFDLREDARLGPTGEAGVAQAARALGSERNFVRLSAGASWAFALLNGFQSAGLSWSGRLESGRIVDQVYGANLYLATPVLLRALRVVGRVGAATILDDTRNSFYVLGGDSGLRGYTIGDLFGKTQMLGHLELRSMSLRVTSLRVGALLFYDVGDAASPMVAPGSGVSRAIRSVLALVPKHDVGVGVRLLIPQLDAYVLRVDWAFATNVTAHTRPGWPGRISLGFRQTF